MPDGHWRATNGAANGPASTHVNGTANGSAHVDGNGNMTLDTKDDPQVIDLTDPGEKVSRPKVVDPEWGELTLEKAREKLVSCVTWRHCRSGLRSHHITNLWFDCVRPGCSMQ